MPIIPPEDLEKLILPKDIRDNDHYTRWLELNGLGYAKETILHCEKYWKGDFRNGKETIFTLADNEHTADGRALKWILTQVFDSCCNSKILNVGCNNGMVCLALKKRYPNSEIYGIDASQCLIGLAIGIREIFGVRDVHYKHHNIMDINSCEYRECEFDIVYSSHTLEHLPSPYLALKEQRRIGKIVCGFAPINDIQENDQHIFILSKEYILKCLKPLFSIHEVREFKATPPHKLDVVAWIGVQ